MKKLSVELFGVFILSFFLLSSCGETSQTDQPLDQMEEESQEIDATREMEKEALREEIRQAMYDIDQKVEKLNESLKTASAKAKTELEKELAELKTAREKLAADLDSFGEKTAEEWDQFKENVKKTIQDIGKDKAEQEQ